MIFRIFTCIRHHLQIYYELPPVDFNDSSVGSLSTAPVSQRSWVRIVFSPEFFSDFNFTIDSYADARWARHAGRLRDESKERLGRRLTSQLLNFITYGGDQIG